MDLRDGEGLRDGLRLSRALEAESAAGVASRALRGRRSSSGGARRGAGERGLNRRGRGDVGARRRRRRRRGAARGRGGLAAAGGSSTAGAREIVRVEGGGVSAEGDEQAGLLRRLLILEACYGPCETYVFGLASNLNLSLVRVVEGSRATSRRALSGRI